jgi:hypothetical protein
MKPIAKKKIRQLEQELITEFVPTIARPLPIAKPKAKKGRGKPDSRPGKIALSYPVELAIVSKFTYDKTIEALMDSESDSSGADAFKGGERYLFWYACSRSSVKPIEAMLKRFGITNVKVSFYPPEEI